MDRQKQKRTILNNLYQDANGVQEFDETIANFTIGQALKELNALELERLDEGAVEKIVKSKMFLQAETKKEVAHYWMAPEGMEFLVKAICDTFGKPRGEIDEVKLLNAFKDIRQKGCDDCSALRDRVVCLSWQECGECVARGLVDKYLAKAIAEKSEDIIRRVGE